MNHIAGNSIEGKWSCMDIVYNQCSEHKAEKKSSKKDERRWEKCLNKIEIISYKYSYQTWCISYALKIMTKNVFVSLKEQKLWIFPYVAILQIDQKVTYVYSWIFQFANILAVSVFIWSLNKLCFVSGLLISSISASVSLKSKILKFWSILSLNRFWNNLNTSLDVPAKNNLWICQELDVQKDSSYLLQIEPKLVVESYFFEDTWNLHSFVWMERIQTEELLERSCYELIDQHTNKLGCWRYQLHVSFLLHIISKEVILSAGWPFCYDIMPELLAAPLYPTPLDHWSTLCLYGLFFEILFIKMVLKYLWCYARTFPYCCWSHSRHNSWKYCHKSCTI